MLLRFPNKRSDVWALIAYLVFVILVLYRSSPRYGLGTPFPCRIAVQMDGVLRCDDTIVHQLVKACGPKWCRDESDRSRSNDVASVWMVAGDKMATSQVCDRIWNQTGDQLWDRQGNRENRMQSADLRGLNVPINVNAASQQDLQSFSGIGPILATRILEQRPFRSLEELLGVRGIGEKKLEKLRKRLRFDWTSDTRLMLRQDEFCGLYDER